MGNYNSYVICTSPRSGSTLLCKLLAATGKAGCPESYFHNPSISNWLDNFDLCPQDTHTKHDILGFIFDAARTRGTGNTGIFGMRLQRKSFSFFTEQIQILHTGFSNDAERFQAAFGNTLFIHLTRANKLEQAISFVKATQTGLWHIAPDGTEIERLSEPQEPVYDAKEIAKQIANLTALDTAWQDWFFKEKIKPFRITYDALSANPEAVLAQVLEQLGVDKAAAKGIKPRVAKLADATSRVWAERYLAKNDVGMWPKS